jgi:twitching motility protein PilU
MKPRILIIDDEPEIRELYRNFLETEDYEITEAQNGQEAFKLAADSQFDLYITDIMMPEMNGVEFMKVLKMIDPDAIVIIVTGFDDMEYTREALNYGAFRFLTKPINMKEFLSVVELGLLERRQLFRTTTTEKLARLKEKLNTNHELQEKVFNKLENFLLLMDKESATFIEMGGQGSKGRIWAKIRGSMLPIRTEKGFNQDEINIMILSILSKNELDSLLQNKNLKFNHEFVHESVRYRYRVMAYFELNELVVAFKPTRRSIIDLDQFAIPQAVLSRITLPGSGGLVVFTGSSGSGKSSLIDSLVDYSNAHAHGSIFIIADSIEYYHESKNCVVRQQEIHSDVIDVLSGLESCADVSPDLVVIEDIRRPEVMDGVFRLLDAGAMVYATLRNRSVLEALQKLINIYPSTSQEKIRSSLASNLNAVIAQTLAPTTKGGLTLAKEIMINTPQIANCLINNNLNDVYTNMLQGKKVGMQSMEQELFDFTRRGIITREVALQFAINSSQIEQMLNYRA